MRNAYAIQPERVKMCLTGEEALQLPGSSQLFERMQYSPVVQFGRKICQKAYPI